MADSKIIKGQAQTLEFGDYDHFGTLIPIAIEGLKSFSGYTVDAIITWDYNDGSGRTIELCEENLENVDYESFGTTLAKELSKLDLTTEDIQIVNDRTYIIKEEDGAIKPFNDYEVSYDLLDPRTGIVREHKSYRVGPFRDEIRAIDYVKKYADTYALGTKGNFSAKKVPMEKALRTL